MIILHVTYQLKESCYEEFTKILNGLQVEKKSRQEKGNIDYSYYRPISGKDEMMLVEVWEDEDSLKAHQQSEHFKELVEIKGDYVKETKIQKFVAARENACLKGEAMNFFEVVKKRYSYRDTFKSEPVPKEDIERIIMAGIQAPSGYNFQSTSFVIITDDAMRKQIGEWIPTNAVQTAPVIILAVSEVIRADTGAYFDMEDYSASAENIMLAITALGYAGVWMNGVLGRDNCERKLAKLVNVPEGKTVRAVIPFGIPVHPGEQKGKKSFAERAVYNCFK